MSQQTYVPPSPQVRWDWISTGIDLIIKQWQPWVLSALIFVAILLVPTLVIAGGLFVWLQVLDDPTARAAALLTVVAFASVFGVFLLAAGAYFSAGLWRAAYKQVNGGQVTVRDLFSGGDVFVPMLGVVFLTVLLIMAGLLLCVIPGFVVAGLLFFAGPLVAIGGLSPVDAIKRSIESTRGDIVSFTIFAFVVNILAGIGGNICYIGMIFTYPLFFTIPAVAYRDCFPTR